MLFTDQMGRTITLAQPPQRIVSLVPSQTELLFYLGLGDRVVGVTKFCIHPAAALATTTKVGGTKKFDFDIIKQLNPDLIIGNKEENEQQQIETLMKDYRVWMSDISNLDESLYMIHGIGSLTGVEAKVNSLVNNIETAFSTIQKHQQITVAYLIWRKPYMAAASGTFIDDMLRRCGFVNIFSDTTRYPEISLENLSATNPNIIFLSSEPYPFGEKHIAELQVVCPNAQILLVDGEMFSWYGNRLLLAPSYFNSLLEKLSAK